MKTFNVNDNVWVQLTDFGREMYIKDYCQLTRTYPSPIQENNSWSKWQLHNLMNCFGHYMNMGSAYGVPFKTDICLEDPNEI